MTTPDPQDAVPPATPLSSLERAKALVEATSSTVAYTTGGAALGASGGVVGAVLGVVTNHDGFRAAITGQATPAPARRKKGVPTP